MTFIPQQPLFVLDDDGNEVFLTVDSDGHLRTADSKAQIENQMGLDRANLTLGKLNTHLTLVTDAELREEDIR